MWSGIKNTLKRFPAIANSYRRFRDSRMLNADPVDTGFGFKLVGNKEMMAGDFEKKETEYIISKIDDFQVFINVGANIGYYCCMAGTRGVRTVAFEPIELNLQYLKKNIISNKLEGLVEIFPVGLGNEATIQKIYGENTGASFVKNWAGSSERNYSYVPINKLDNIVGSRFANEKIFVMIDVEGFELYVLEGSESLLTHSPAPVWLVEICINEHQPAGLKINPNLEKTFSLFWEHGYTAWSVEDEINPISKEQIREIQINGVDTIGSHNFIFKK